MQLDNEQVVLEEHPIEVTSSEVHLCDIMICVVHMCASMNFQYLKEEFMTHQLFNIMSILNFLTS